MCVTVTIPNDIEYLGQLIGLLDTLKWSKNFAPDETKTGAATVSRTWQSALESVPITAEGCNVPDFRIDPETCLLEVNCSSDPENPDWQPVSTPAYDPATDGIAPVPYPDPPPEGQTNQCLAAANAASALKAWGDLWTDDFDSIPFVNLITRLASLIQVIMTLAIDVLIDNVNLILFEINAATIEADFASITAQEIQDVLVCFYDENGVMQPDQFGDALNALGDKIPENQGWALVRMLASMVGFVGLTLMAKIGGITDADCEGCGIPCEGYDSGLVRFKTDASWPNVSNERPGQTLTLQGSYTQNQGWSYSEFNNGGVSRGISLKIELPVGAVVQKVRARYVGHASNPTACGLGYGMYVGGGVVAATGWSENNMDFDVEQTWEGSIAATTVHLWCDVGCLGDAVNADVDCVEIEICGTGLE